MTLTKAEVAHVVRAVEDYRELVESYPEVATSRQEDRLAIAEEILSDHT
jgi:hypothetical protein